MKKKIITLFFAVVLCLCFAACGNTGEQPSGGDTPPVTDNETENKNELLYGIAEPFAGTNVTGFNPDREAYLAGALGAKTFRLWMSDSNLFGAKYTSVISNEELAQVPRSAKLMYDAYISSLRENGIKEITCMGMLFPRVQSTAVNRDGSFVPRRDASEGSEYMQFLQKVEIVWKTVAEAFTDVDVWEMGNETNVSVFLSYADGSPTAAELAQINADYMYYARKGIKEGNPEAVAITPGYSPYGGITVVRDFLRDVYANIESGNFPSGNVKSANPDDYFDGVAWHPYDVATGMDLSAEPDLQQWIDGNNEVYEVMKEHNDGDKKVWFTEFGHSVLYTKLDVLNSSAAPQLNEYTINGVRYAPNDNAEQEQTEWIRAYLLALPQMEYVHTCHYFRLCCAVKDAEWGGIGEVFFGCFLEPDAKLGRGFYPRKKAYVIQQIYGGQGDLMKYA